MKNTKIIKKNYEFRYFFKKGKYFSGELLEIFVFKNNDSSNKLGIIVSKKVGGSVIRNKVKRFIREAYKELEDKIILIGNEIVNLYSTQSCYLEELKRRKCYNRNY